MHVLEHAVRVVGNVDAEVLRIDSFHALGQVAQVEAAA